jgi:hypothetical protein
LNTMSPATISPSHMGPRQRQRGSDTPPMKSQSEQNRLRNEDSKVRRGAEIIRQQIQQKLDDDDAFRKQEKRAELARAKELRNRVASILKTTNSLVEDNKDPEQMHAELKWKHAVGDGDGSHETTCSTTGSSDDEEGGKPFWGPAGEKRRAALYDGAVDLISKGRKTLQFQEKEPTQLSRRETGAELFCPVRCMAEMSERGTPFHEEIEQWSGNPEFPPAPPDEDSPITFIGRGKSLRAKMVTYLVEPFGSDGEDFSASDGFSDDFDVDATDFHSTSTTTTSYLPPTLQQNRDEAKVTRSERLNVIQEYESVYPMSSTELRQSLPTQEKRQPAVVTPTAAALGASVASVATTTDLAVPSPISKENFALRKDPAYQHAQNAGFLWQSLVGQQIRFPRQWWGEAQTPPMGAQGDAKWQYVGRYKVQSNKSLNKMVDSRVAPGRLLLHIVVQDLMTWKPVQDVVIGCFHPNARGIRETKNADPKEERNRDIWLAVRRRSDAVSAVDSLLMVGKPWEASNNASPLGPRTRVANNNVRAVFGEEPPVETVFALESDLYQQLSNVSPGSSAPLALLNAYVLG